ncbi:MAG: prepilin-type N-terminal cleavage/methylation domain-containing protein [Opitutales bacterium]
MKRLTNRPLSRGLRKRRPAAGFTLLEMMVAMAIFIMVSLGITAGVFQARRLAESNIVRNTAFTVAQGYLEQIKSMSANEMLDAIGNPSATPLPTMSISALATGVVEIDDPLFLTGTDTSPSGVAGTNAKTVLIDLQPDDGGTEREMVLNVWFDLQISQVGVRTYQTILDFEYQSPNIFAARELRTGSVRMVTTHVND